MLGDRSGETVGEVRHRVVTGDPRFAASFAAIGPRDSSCSVHWACTLPRWACTAAVISVLRRRRDQSVRRES